jgi:hypothetical protein
MEGDLCGIEAIRDASSGKEYIPSASIIFNSDSETILSKEYNSSAVEADKSILGIGRSAFTSSCSASAVNIYRPTDITLRRDILGSHFDILVDGRGKTFECFGIDLTAKLGLNGCF